MLWCPEWLRFRPPPLPDLALRLLLLLSLSLTLATTVTTVFASPLFAEGKSAVHPSLSSSRPSWFPRTSCREAWRNRDLSRYDEATDAQFKKGVGNLGYQTYLERIAREHGVYRTDCHKDWTILVYMSADNDLSPYALWDLHEMEGPFKGKRLAGSTLKTDLIVQADTAGRTGIRRLHIFQKPGDTYVVPRGIGDFVGASPAEIHSPMIAMLDEKAPANSNDHQKRLRAFLDWGMRAYPAKHYFVILWGHGQGWTANSQSLGEVGGLGDAEPAASLTSESSSSSPSSAFAGRFGGLAFSETKDDYLGIPSLSSILREVKDTTLEGRPIDLYASDACLMQMVEVAYEISDSTRFVSGSAQVHSFLGLPYRQLLYEINSGSFMGGIPGVKTDDEPYMIAHMLPRLLARSMDPLRGQQGRADPESSRTFTMSSLSTAALRHELVPALHELGARILAYVTEDPLRAMDLRFLMKDVPSFMGGAKELGSFLGLLKIQLANEAVERNGWTRAAANLASAIEVANGAVRRTSISDSFGSNYSHSRGPQEQEAGSLRSLGFRSLGIWLPRSPQDFSIRIDDFRQSLFYTSYNSYASSPGPSPWEQGLRAIYGGNSSSQFRIRK